MRPPRSTLLLVLAATAALAAHASLARPPTPVRGDGNSPPPLDTRDVILARGRGTIEAETRLDPAALLERFRTFLRGRPVTAPGVGPALLAWLTDARVLAVSKGHLLAGRMDPDGTLRTLVAFREPGSSRTWYSLTEDRGFLPAGEDGSARLASGHAGACFWEVRRGAPRTEMDAIPLGEGEYALLSPDSPPTFR